MVLAAEANLTVWKYHGLGNDFIVVEASASEATRFRQQGVVARLCDRRRGIGADGVLLVDRSAENADARMVVLNRDGSRPEMCGNGVRCVVRHLVETHDLSSAHVTIATDAGLRTCGWDAHDTWRVSVMMGLADVESDRVTVDAGGAGEYTFRRVDMGNPHAVTFQAASVEQVDAVGRLLNDDDARFPEGVNLEFAQVSKTSAGRPRLDVVVYERGVGRTLACGTGACASAAAYWMEQGGLDDGQSMTVGLPGGDLDIDVVEGQIRMTGPVCAVFKGQLASDGLRD